MLIAEASVDFRPTARLLSGQRFGGFLFAPEAIAFCTRDKRRLTIESIWLFWYNEEADRLSAGRRKRARGSRSNQMAEGEKESSRAAMTMAAKFPCGAAGIAGVPMETKPGGGVRASGAKQEKRGHEHALGWAVCVPCRRTQTGRNRARLGGLSKMSHGTVQLSLDSISENRCRGYNGSIRHKEVFRCNYWT